MHTVQLERNGMKYAASYNICSGQTKYLGPKDFLTIGNNPTSIHANRPMLIACHEYTDLVGCLLGRAGVAAVFCRFRYRFLDGVAHSKVRSSKIVLIRIGIS